MTKEDYNKNRPRTQCPNCGKLITNATFEKHYSACINPNSKINSRKGIEKYKLDHDDLFCKFCSKKCQNKNSLIQHEIRCKQNPNRKDFNNLGNYCSMCRKGKTKEQLLEIQRQVDTMKAKYQNGYVSPNKGKHIQFDYIYSEHNQEQINKWVQFIDSLDIELPLYTIKDKYLEEYTLVKLTENIKYATNKNYLFEHELIVSTYLGKINVNNYTIHHLDRIRSNNDIHNLLVFKTNSDHKRFHNSKFAYLLYDEIDHTFICEIRKID